MKRDIRVRRYDDKQKKGTEQKKGTGTFSVFALYRELYLSPFSLSLFLFGC